ncbi:MAG: hypothetical protein IJ772_05085 [Bacilli bacterium]|nr:hypothetical protein [Bacilli bacterium]
MKKLLKLSRTDLFDDNFKHFLFLGSYILEVVRYCEIVKRNIFYLFDKSDSKLCFNSSYTMHLDIPFLNNLSCKPINYTFNRNSFICNELNKKYPLNQLKTRKDIHFFIEKLLSFKSNLDKYQLGTIPLLEFEFELQPKSEKELKIGEKEMIKMCDIFYEYINDRTPQGTIIGYSKVNIEIERKEGLKFKGTLLFEPESAITDWCDFMLIGQKYEEIIDIIDDREKLEISLERLEFEIKIAREKNNVILRR